MVKYLIPERCRCKTGKVLTIIMMVTLNGTIFHDPFIYGNLSGIAAGTRNLPLLKYLVEECGIPVQEGRQRLQELRDRCKSHFLRVSRKRYEHHQVFTPEDTTVTVRELTAISSVCNIRIDSMIIVAIRREMKMIKRKCHRLCRTGHPDEQSGIIKQLILDHPY